MMKSIYTLLFLFLLCSGNTHAQARVESADRHPELVLDANGITSAKVFLAKDAYRIGELIRVDVGVLFLPHEEVFIPNDLNFRLKIEDRAGRRIPIEIMGSSGISSAYHLATKDYIFTSWYGILGCDDIAIKEYERKFDSFRTLDPEELFRAGAVSPPASFCVNVPEEWTGDLFMTAEFINDTVVLPTHQGPTKRTVVGSVVSGKRHFAILKDH